MTSEALTTRIALVKEQLENNDLNWDVTYDVISKATKELRNIEREATQLRVTLQKLQEADVQYRGHALEIRGFEAELKGIPDTPENKIRRDGIYQLIGSAMLKQQRLEQSVV